MWRPERDCKKIPVSTLGSHIQKLYQKAGEGYGERTELDLEWEELSRYHKEMIGDGEVWLTGQMPANRSKNRYADVLPNDDTRVKLKKKRGEGGEIIPSSDYINSNFIDGKVFCLPNNNYICAQAPTSSTVDDFWRMVWENSVSLILMLTKEVESDRKKCVPYWPAYPSDENKDPILRSGEFVVSWHAEPSEQPDNSVDGELIKNYLKISGSNGKSRIILHVQHVAWPDHGVPEQHEGFCELLRVTDDFNNILRAPSASNSETAPTLVHCSAGIGRTGCFLGIHIITTLYKKYLSHLRNSVIPASHPFSVDIVGTIMELRSQRAGMVQSIEQLEFMYTALLSELDRISKEYTNEALT